MNKLHKNIVREYFFVKDEAIELKLFKHDNINKEYLECLNDKHLMKYSNQRFIEHSESSCRKYLEKFKESNNLFLAIYVNNIYIGTATAYFSNELNSADIGIMIFRNFSNLGYAFKAWSLLMNYLFSVGIKKITAGTMKTNLAMISIIIKSGMMPDNEKLILQKDKDINVLYFYKCIIND